MTDTLTVNSKISLRPFWENDIEAALMWYADPVVLSGTISPGRTRPRLSKARAVLYY